MLRFLFKRLSSKKQRTTIIKFYRSCKLSVQKFVGDKTLLYTSLVSITLPKRQQHFNFFDLKTKKYIHFSAGSYLLKIGRKAKFFKRNPKNLVSIVLQLKRDYPVLLKYIYIYYIKNFNYRQLNTLKKLYEILNPKIYYLCHRQSFLPQFLPKRRIKKRVYKKLLKQ